MTDCWFYLSFADPDRPEGEQFLGAAYIEADSDVAAVARSHALDINPGGEVMIAGPLPGAVLEEHVAREDRERLLTREEIPDAMGWPA